MADPLTLSSIISLLISTGVTKATAEALELLSEGDRRKLAAKAILREWDDRLGISRLWLMRANTQWVTTGHAHDPFRCQFEDAGPDDAEAIFHATRVLNFIDDVRRAVNVDRVVTLKDLGPFPATLDLWWSRLRPYALHVRRDRGPGWADAQTFVEAIVAEERGSKAMPPAAD